MEPAKKRGRPPAVDKNEQEGLSDEQDLEVQEVSAVEPEAKATVVEEEKLFPVFVSSKGISCKVVNDGNKTLRYLEVQLNGQKRLVRCDEPQRVPEDIYNLIKPMVELGQGRAHSNPGDA